MTLLRGGTAAPWRRAAAFEFVAARSGFCRYVARCAAPLLSAFGHDMGGADVFFLITSQPQVAVAGQLGTLEKAL